MRGALDVREAKTLLVLGRSGKGRALFDPNLVVEKTLE